MSSLPLLKSYLLANALLVASYLVFQATRKSLQTAKLNAGFRPLIKCAQLLIALSALLPLSFSLLPQKTLNRIEAQVVQPSDYLPGDELAANKAGSRRNRLQLSRSTLVPAEQALGRAADWLNDKRTSTAVMALRLLLALGSAAFATVFMRNVLRLRRTLSDAIPVRTISRVRIVVSQSIAVPFSAWLGGASWIAIPERMLASSGDFKIAVRHELQHHRQGDTAWAMAIEVLVCAFFANPFIYLWKRQIIELQEFSCDEALIGRKRVSANEYGSCLVRVAEAALGARDIHVGTTCMAMGSRNPFYFKSFLRRRVEMFTNHRSPRTNRWAGIGIGTIAAVCLMTLAFGAEQSLRNRYQEKSNPGQVIVDPEIQKIADGILSKAVEVEKAKAGFAIVADPNTGKILAVANIDTTGKQTGYWSLSELFEPASVVKGLVAAQALDKGLTTPEEQHGCENGSYRYGDRVYHDWKGWNSLSTERTVVMSSDICTMKLAEKIGSDGLLEMLQKFGFGPEGTAKEFPQARAGQLPSSDDDSQRPRVVPYVSYGAGFAISPIEMVQAYGAIANGGNLMAPKSANTPDSEAQVIRRVLSPQSSEKMRRILEQVVEKGTAVPGKSKLYSQAGKTATSHYPRSMPYDPNDGNFAGFIGFAPVKDPRVEIYVGIRDPESKSGAHGGGHAAPVFRELAEEILKFMKVAPDKQ